MGMGSQGVGGLTPRPAPKIYLIRHRLLRIRSLWIRPPKAPTPADPPPLPAKNLWHPTPCPSLFHPLQWNHHVILALDSCLQSTSTIAILGWFLATERIGTLHEEGRAIRGAEKLYTPGNIFFSLNLYEVYLNDSETRLFSQQWDQSQKRPAPQNDPQKISSSFVKWHFLIIKTFWASFCSQNFADRIPVQIGRREACTFPYPGI